MSQAITDSPAAKALIRKVAGHDQSGGNPRLKTIVERVTRDICRIIEDLDVTPTEFWSAVSYLTRLGQANEIGLLVPGLGIEHFLDLLMDEQERKAGIAGGTPRTIEGPLYIAGAPLAKGEARLDQDPEHGKVLFMQGQVRDTHGKPVAGAIVDVWHANTLGFYSHFDPSQSKFNLRRRIETDREGRYRFRSIMPSGYGCPPDGPTQQLLSAIGRHGKRPAHIHFFVEAPGFRKLTTQINIDGDEYLHDDFAFATRDGLIPEVVEHDDPAELKARGLNEPFASIDFDFTLVAEGANLPEAVVLRDHAPRLTLERTMPDTLPQLDAGSLGRDLAIRSITSTIIDVPTLRQHKLSQTSVTAQNYVLVQVRLGNGAEGIGEAATLGGPRWSEESVEAIKANIDAYLAPALLGQPADRFVAAASRMEQAAKRNNAAKAAIETALFDAVGRTLGLPVAALLGGAVRDRIPVLWTLASGDPAQEIEEAEAKLAAGLHRTFKVKIGAQPPAADLARLERLAAAFGDRAELIVDANQAWDETIARSCLPALQAMGIRLVEQPLPAWNVDGMARLRASVDTPPLLADECVFDAHDMLRVAAAAAADAVSLKLVKHGGLLGTRRVAAVAEAAGIGLYGGCLLESSVGAAAHLHVFAALPELAWGCEHFGPQILVGEYVAEPLHFADGHVHLPAGPGLGVTLDADKLKHYARG